MEEGRDFVKELSSLKKGNVKDSVDLLSFIRKEHPEELFRPDVLKAYLTCLIDLFSENQDNEIGNWCIFMIAGLLPQQDDDMSKTNTMDVLEKDFGLDPTSMNEAIVKEYKIALESVVRIGGVEKNRFIEKILRNKGR